jgi:rubredoxin/uncharacterized membrane protein
MKVWQCSVCKYIHKGDTPPEKCPICGVGPEKFVEIDEASIPEKSPKRRRPKEKVIISKMQDVPKVIEKTGLEKIQDFLLKHHAHPVSVHTPNGILPFAVILWVLAWLFDNELFAKAALINMVFVIIVLPFVLFTGVLAWKKKYNGAMTLIFKLKIMAATITTASCTINLVWYLIDPQIISSPKAWVFILMNIIMLAAAGIAGHIGGGLVFKD